MSYKGFTITENYEGVKYWMNFDPSVIFYSSSVEDAKLHIDEIERGWKELAAEDLALYEKERKG